MHFRPTLRNRTLWTALALTAALVLSVLWVAAAAQARPAATTSDQPAQPASKIAPRVLADTANGGRTSVVIFLNDQADVSAGYGMKDEDARGWYVYTTLFNKAAQTQVSLRSMLSAAGVSFQSFWVANMIVADNADRTLVDMLAARADVRAVDSNAAARWIEPPTIANFQPASASPDTVEWGVQRVNAPQVWALGYTGQGIVIANQDTGMRWTQAAIKPHYRGWNGTSADHNYNWHDSIHSGGGVCGANSLVPCDDSGHGTHTTGTTSGDDGSGNQVGVAPGAKWIGCRNMDQGNGTPASYSECFQFFIAPTDLNGQNPNPALRPHVMNNSWGCPTSEGCTTRGELETIVNNTQASGIFVEASAGNSGTACSSVTDPPAIYDAAFSTGATDINNNLASFSSRGPSTYYTPNLLKPNVSAPGVNVRSSYYSSDTSYATLSGTSMAGPHVVGVVALLWSARPQLARDITDTKQILENTANPGVVAPAQTCGGIPSSQIPNNSFGYGLVDALAAVNSVAQGTPTPTATSGAATATRTSTPAASATRTSTPTGATATPTACAPTSWAVASPVPTAVEGGFLTTDGTYAYLAGGYDGSVVISRFARYNPPANTWTVLAAMPTPADGTGIVYSPVNNKVYVFGGADDPGNALAVTRIYDVAGGTWTTGATMPAARQRFAAVGYWNGQIYLVGGRTDLSGNSAQPQVWRYDPVANSWNTSLASMPVGTGGAGWGVLNGHIYVLSGIDSSGAISTAVYDYDISANTWTSRAAVPTGVNTPGSAVVGGRIWIFGGDDGTLGASRAADHAPHADTNLTQVYDPASNSWSAGPSLNVNRSDVGGTTVGAYVIAADGFAGGVLDTTEVGLGGCAPATATPVVPTATATTAATQAPSATATTAPATSPTTVPTAAASATATPAGGSPTATVTLCAITFSDVHPTDYFYEPVRYLYCHGVISGYGDNTFRPYNNTTRAQMVKIVVLGFAIPVQTPTGGAYTFHDVPPAAPFFDVIETAAAHNIISGYNCGPGGPGPCDPQNRPYFLPNNPVTRGQLSKIDVIAAGWPQLNPTTPTFTDVPRANPFYTVIETAVCHGVVSGYADHTFHPFAEATRGQIAKIVYLSILNAPGSCAATPAAGNQ